MDVVAGIVPVGQPSGVSGLGANYAHASDAAHDSHDDHGDPAQESHSTDDAHDAHSADAEHDVALAAAGQLVPQPEDIPWFGPMLYVVVGLFVAAVVLGIPALKMRGPEPVDPADTHSH